MRRWSVLSCLRHCLFLLFNACAVPPTRTGIKQPIVPEVPTGILRSGGLGASSSIEGAQSPICSQQRRLACPLWALSSSDGRSLARPFAQRWAMSPIAQRFRRVFTTTAERGRPFIPRRRRRGFRPSGVNIRFPRTIEADSIINSRTEIRGASFDCHHSKIARRFLDGIFPHVTPCHLPHGMHFNGVLFNLT